MFAIIPDDTGAFLMNDTARYNCSASNTRTKPCGSVSADNAKTSSADFLIFGV